MHEMGRKWRERQYVDVPLANKHGVCIVTPDEQFKVVIYGNHLDKIAQLIFTPTNNCSDGKHVVDATNDFILDDISTWITTEKPPKEYFLPLPVQ
ncbi:hypothetical protein TELCIR_21319, partial [Teladorsagia circumcincta]